MLQITASKRLGEFALDLALSVEDRTVLVLVGENGSGKTTLLRLLAGLARPDGGRIVLDGDVLFDGAAGICVPAPERPVGFVSQDYALFPHLTVFENVAFGLRARGLRGAELRPRVDGALARLGVLDLARRRPHELSGGQQQRVALARALVPDPRLLLLDEPLSALDLQTRGTVRRELRRLLAELPCVTVFVTHSPTEALALGERIAVLEAGRISQQGPRDDLLRHPRSDYVAQFLGVNLFRGTVVAREPGGLALVAVPGSHFSIVDPGAGGDLTLAVYPRAITLSLQPPLGSARNILQGRIEELVPEPPAGDQVRVLIASDPPLAAEVTREAVEALGLRPGLEVYAAFKATGVAILP
jgi:molybdate transport system ATP-binding protein